MQDFMIESNDPNLAFKWCPRIANNNRCEQRCAAIDETLEKKDRTYTWTTYVPGTPMNLDE